MQAQAHRELQFALWVLVLNDVRAHAQNRTKNLRKPGDVDSVNILLLRQKRKRASSARIYENMSFSDIPIPVKGVYVVEFVVASNHGTWTCFCLWCSAHLHAHTTTKYSHLKTVGQGSQAMFDEQHVQMCKTMILVCVVRELDRWVWFHIRNLGKVLRIYMDWSYMQNGYLWAKLLASHDPIHLRRVYPSRYWMRVAQKYDVHKLAHKYPDKPYTARNFLAEPEYAFGLSKLPAISSQLRARTLTWLVTRWKYPSGQELIETIFELTFYFCPRKSIIRFSWQHVGMKIQQ